MPNTHLAAEDAIKKGREFEKKLKNLAETADDDERAIAAADTREFQSRVAGICTNLEQHLNIGTYGEKE
jgi:hypothetical protein